MPRLLLASLAATLVLAAPASADLPPQGPPVQADQPPAISTVVGPPAPSSSPVFAIASKTFRTMTSTTYTNHHYEEDTETGVYKFDCVGAVDWFLAQAVPKAHAAMSATEHIARGYVPTPSRMYAFLSAKSSKPYFTRIRRPSAIRPGDVFILEGGGEKHDSTKPYPGHAMIAASGPLLLSTGGYAVMVYDSTGGPHGADDSRRWDPRTQPVAGTSVEHGGLGFGTVEVHPASGKRGMRMSWSVGVDPEPHPFLVSRAKRERNATPGATGTEPSSSEGSPDTTYTPPGVNEPKKSKKSR